MSTDIEFWQTEGINYLRWTDGPEYYEGEENVHTTVEFVGQGQLRDVGCGYGRLAKNFKPENYIGYDICLAAVKKATKMNPAYTFIHWDLSSIAPAETTLFANGPHLVNDKDIDHVLDIMCADTNVIVISELMGREFRSIPYPYGVYHRTIEEYDTMMQIRKFKRTKSQVGTHLRLKAPYTIARWERYA